MYLCVFVFTKVKTDVRSREKRLSNDSVQKVGGSPQRGRSIHKLVAKGCRAGRLDFGRFRSRFTPYVIDE